MNPRSLGFDEEELMLIKGVCFFFGGTVVGWKVNNKMSGEYKIWRKNAQSSVH